MVRIFYHSIFFSCKRRKLFIDGDAVKRAAKYFLPFLLLGKGVILYLYFTTNKGVWASASTQGTGFPIASMCLFASLVFVQYISGAIASFDITRYAKSPAHGFFDMFSGNTGGFMMTNKEHL
ncbi:hypothetical protein [Metabacillus sp. RGM 3146]|uniref:hypothetical protein n=1 Tax=Metabacillus sp. RGM 3146 TaxID=3401092 RepID=UPI003B9C146D